MQVWTYRGYRLIEQPWGIEIWHTGELIVQASTIGSAHSTIDEWMDAP